jgi:protein-S-isoprenylcysteine O-methyltransferase Ste14
LLRVGDAAKRLARWRVPLGYVLGIAAFLLAAPTASSLALGASVGGAGEALRIWAAGHLEKGREVTRSGPYALTRHPLYLGSATMGAGFAIAARSLVVALIAGTYLVLTITAAIRSEEAHLTDKFGSAYPDYRDGRGMEAPRRFTVERAMRNREYRALAGFIAVIALLAARMYL